MQLRRRAARVLHPVALLAFNNLLQTPVGFHAVIDGISGHALADPVLPRPTAMPMDPMEMPRDLMAMPGPTVALQQVAITRAHGYGKLSSGELLRCGGLMQRQRR